MRLYLADIKVVFKDPGDIPPEAAGTTTPIIGYVRIYLLQAPQAEDARAMVVREINDGAINWRDSSIREVRHGDLDPDMRSRCAKEVHCGICYRSGKLFFPLDESG